MTVARLQEIASHLDDLNERVRGLIKEVWEASIKGDVRAREFYNGLVDNEIPTFAHARDILREVLP